MNNVDFISEKWRTCRRTRKLAHIHFASSILPIIYVAVYAEAQRRDEDYKEFGAALAALMFNVFQLMRTIMGIAQLNAFVAWCKHAVECLHALLGEDQKNGENNVDSSGEVSIANVTGTDENNEPRSGQETRMLNGIAQLDTIVRWCKLDVIRLRGILRTENRRALETKITGILSIHM